MNWHKKVDRIFVINLPENKERLSKIENELNKNGLFNYTVIKAVKDENGERGLCKTMTILLDKCIGEGYQDVLILEDDATFIQPSDVIDKSFDQLPKDYDLFYLGCTLMTRPERVSENILRVVAAYASHAILYSREGLIKSYNALVKNDGHAYDVVLQSGMFGATKYCSFPMICSQRAFVSDIYKPSASDIENNKVLAPYYNKETRVMDWGKFMEHQYSIMTKNI